MRGKKKEVVKCKKGRETNLLLSQNVKITHDARKVKLGCENVLVVGATGSGKSFMYLKPNIYSLPTDPNTGMAMSLVMTDPKGELCHDTAQFLENHGYEIRILNLNEPRFSSCYNPFKYIKEDKDILIMIDALINNSIGDGGNDPFWNQMASALLCSIAFYLYYECKFSQQNFTEVSKLLEQCGDRNEDKNKPSSYEKKLQTLEQTSNKGSEHPAITWYNKVKDSKGNTFSSILSSAQGAVRLFASKDIQRLTYTDTLDLDRIGDSEKPVALYLITSSTDSSYDFIVTMVYTQLFSSLMFRANTVYADKGNSLPRHILFFLDEFANIGQIPDFDKKIAVFRQANMSCSIILQTPAQLKTLYEKSYNNIIGNTSIVLFLGNAGLGDDSAADWISKALGSKTIQVENTSVDKGKGGGLFFDPTSLNHSYSATERALMRPEEVRMLPGDECLVIIAGRKPFRDKKITPFDALNFDEAKELKYNIKEKMITSESFRKGIAMGKYVDEEIARRRLEELAEDNKYQEDEIKEALEEVPTNTIVLDALYADKMYIDDLGKYVKKEIVKKEIRSFSPTHEWDLPDGEQVEEVSIVNTWDDALEEIGPRPKKPKGTVPGVAPPTIFIDEDVPTDDDFECEFSDDEII